MDENKIVLSVGLLSPVITFEMDKIDINRFSNYDPIPSEYYIAYYKNDTGNYFNISNLIFAEEDFIPIDIKPLLDMLRAAYHNFEYIHVSSGEMFSDKLEELEAIMTMKLLSKSGGMNNERR